MVFSKLMESKKRGAGAQLLRGGTTPTPPRPSLEWKKRYGLFFTVFLDWMMAPAPDEAIDLEQGLRQAEADLLRLKARYAQVQADQQRQIELKNRLDDVHGNLRRDKTPELKAELQQIQQQLDALEVALESQLFSWSGLKEVFWQAVRFGGLGIVIGWVLRSIAL